MQKKFKLVTYGFLNFKENTGNFNLFVSYCLKSTLILLKPLQILMYTDEIRHKKNRSQYFHKMMVSIYISKCDKDKLSF